MLLRKLIMASTTLTITKYDSREENLRKNERATLESLLAQRQNKNQSWTLVHA